MERLVENVFQMLSTRSSDLVRGFWAETVIPECEGMAWVHPQGWVLLVSVHGKLCIRTFRNIRAYCTAHNIQHSIFVISSFKHCTARVRMLLEEFVYGRSPSWLVELFEARQFCINLISHRLVLPHTKIADVRQLVVDLLGRDDVDAVREFPKLRAQDPVARYYGFLPGTVVAVQRAHGEMFYRFCVDSP